MALKKNAKGHCNERVINGRAIEVLELNLCDYFEGKRRNNKPLCKNCVHFNLSKTSIKKKIMKKDITEDKDSITKDDV